MITSLNQLDPNKKYTYTDYLTWQFKERVELIMGKIFQMSPAPTTRHQQISWRLSKAIAKLKVLDRCEVFTAPFDVRIRTKGKDYLEVESVVQPDISIICNKAKLDEKGCDGIPDLIIEILSPSSSSRDLKEKYLLYEQAHLPEYWIVNPVDGVISVFCLNDDGVFETTKPYVREETIKSITLPGLEIVIEEIFPGSEVSEQEIEYEKSIRRF